MTQALYAHMNNNKKRKKKIMYDILMKTVVGGMGFYSLNIKIGVFSSLL
jgi:hypothetical protein